MSVNALDHVNIRTSRYDETIAFYRDVIGLSVTPPPAMADTRMAAWLCDGEGRPILHLLRGGTPVSALGDMDPDGDDVVGTGPVHHVALDCAGHARFVERLEARGLTIKHNHVEPIDLRQIFVFDPNGMLVELNFRAA